MEATVELRTEYIRLAALLKLADVVQSGGEAKMLIQEGYVQVNDATDTRRGAKIRPGDVVVVEGEPPLRIQVVPADA
ncbi:MAG: RNA-binding S4 domain-containing protein [Planctomycetota bacterium]|nr:RNA-binding S4 domain-containing protein [Planctomycetota bacterium]